MADERDQLERVRQDVVRRYAEVADPLTVEACFDAVVAGFADATVRTYVPVLTERRLRQVLARA